MDEPLEFAEVLDREGNVAMVLHKKSIGGTEMISVVTPDMAEEKDAYAKLYNVTWSDTVKGNWPTTKPTQVSIS